MGCRALNALVTKPVVTPALLRIAQYAIGFSRLFELLLGNLVARITVRVVLQRKSAVGAFQALFIDGMLDAEDLVVVSVSH